MAEISEVYLIAVVDYQKQHMAFIGNIEMKAIRDNDILECLLEISKLVRFFKQSNRLQINTDVIDRLFLLH